MNENKSLFLEVAETIDRRLSQRKPYDNDLAPHPSHLRRFLRWLTPNGGTLLLVAVLIATAQVWARPLASTASAPGPSATTVNYQGRLADDAGNPLDGSYGMTFALYDAASGGNLVWGPESHAAVPVSEGLFSVGLGSQTSGGIPTSVWNGDRYLEITVGGETLSPRELIRSVPVAGIALDVLDGAIGPDQIADEAVTAAKIAPSAILTNLGNVSTYSDQVVMSGTSTYYVFPGTETTIDVPSASRVLIVASGGLAITDGSGQIYAAICRDGVRKGRTTYYSHDATAVFHEQFSWTYIDTVDTGSYTYSLCGAGSTGLTAWWYHPNIALVVIPGE